MSVTHIDLAASNHQVISAKKVAPPDVLPTPLMPPTLRSSPKIRDRHRDRLAVVYVRQSSPHQVLENRESRERQYGLAMLAQQFGWPADRVLVIDEDQGLSGKRAENRGGFQRLLNEVAMDHVGMVLGLELSRLARSCKDWHHLVEVCAVFDTLLYDQDGVYNANDGNDRLLLGMKGAMSEYELITLRNRLERGRENKAARGELFLHLPIGYVKSPSGEVLQEPDEQAVTWCVWSSRNSRNLVRRGGYFVILFRTIFNSAIVVCVARNVASWNGVVLRRFAFSPCCGIRFMPERMPTAFIVRAARMLVRDKPRVANGSCRPKKFAC